MFDLLSLTEREAALRLENTSSRDTVSGANRHFCRTLVCVLLFLLLLLKLKLLILVWHRA